MKLKFGNIFLKSKKIPLRDIAKSFIYVPRLLGRLEKIIIAVAAVMLIVGLSLLWYNSWIKTTMAVAKEGGTMNEGFVGESKDADRHIARLVNAGLTRYDAEKGIVGDLADSWEIANSGKVYTFHLKPSFNSDDLVAQISAKNLWKDIAIAAPDPSTITFTFDQPFSPFLNISSEPIFNYGPYQIVKETKNEIDLSARDDYYAGRPFISKIAIKFYPNQDKLLAAARHGDIDGYTTNVASLVEGFNEHLINLPRDLDLFFNLNNKTLADINIRKDLKENISPGKELSFRLVTTDNSKNTEFGKKLVEGWAKIGIKVELQIKTNVDLQKTVIPARDYDMLLYGLDYGDDPDPYPFWHSSQATADGKNLSNFKNTQADKLLEQARQEVDPKKRETYYDQFKAILNSQMPMFEVEHENLYYYTSTKIQGVPKIVGFSETDRFLTVSSWYIDTKRVKK